MIIPGLVAQHAKQDTGQQSDDENDGLSQMERESIARTLELLAAGSATTGGGDVAGRTLAPPTARPTLPAVDRPTAPPTVVAASSLARSPLATRPPTVAAAPDALPPKKMSR